MLALFPPVCRLLGITVLQVSIQLVIRALCRQKIHQYTLQVVDHVNSNYVAWGGDIRFSDTFQVCETALTMLPAASSVCLSVHENCPGDR